MNKSDNVDLIYLAPPNLKSHVWKTWILHEKGSVGLQLKIPVAPQNSPHNRCRWHGETYKRKWWMCYNWNKLKTSQSQTSYALHPQLIHNSARSKAITASEACLNAKDFQSSCDCFHDMINTLEPKYKIPNRQHFSNKCVPELYMKVNGCEKRSNARTSCKANSYVTITVHYNLRTGSCCIKSVWQNELKHFWVPTLILSIDDVY